jgi:hypothetical protein
LEVLKVLPNVNMVHTEKRLKKTNFCLIITPSITISQVYIIQVEKVAIHSSPNNFQFKSKWEGVDANYNE